jgi:serine protease Do
VTSFRFWSSPFLILPILFGAGCQQNSQPPPQHQANKTQTAATPPPTGTYVAPLAQPLVVTGQLELANLVSRLAPAVVSISAIHTAPAPQGERGFPFGFPFGGNNPHSRRQGSALGSGFIVDPAGYVVTNAHVIENATEIKVRLADERQLHARIVGRDRKLDLALLKLEGATSLAAVTLGDSDTLRVGDPVIAIGNPFGLGHTVTLGITSAKNRTIGAGPYDAFIQTDASINPGNSGGPLFNLKGEVVGIPTAIRHGAQGIGFAVPVNSLKDVLQQLKEHGSVTRGKLGVHIQHINENLASALGLKKAEGALVSNLEPSSAGARAGLKVGDVILSVNSKAVRHSEDLPRLVARHKPGTQVTLGVFHEGQMRNIKVTLDELEESHPTHTTPVPVSQPKGKLGLKVDDNPEGTGARVRGLSSNSPATGSLFPGDIIVQIGKTRIKDAQHAVDLINQQSSGKSLLLRVVRGRSEMFVGIKLP